MSIFLNDPTKRSIRRRTGRTGYFDADWHGFSGDVVDTISGKMQNFTMVMKEKTNTWANMSRGQLDESVSKFRDFGLENMREGYIAKRMNEAQYMREDALDDGFNEGMANRVTNLGQAQANRDRRIQGYLKAKSKLGKAQDIGGEQQASYRYNLTEHEMLNPIIDDYYMDFDAMIDSRKQAYAQAYGMESFDDFTEGFGMFATTEVEREVATGEYRRNGQSYYYNGLGYNPYNNSAYEEVTETRISEVQDHSAVGQQDILNMIFSDLTGMSYDELTYASTAELGFTQEATLAMLNERNEADRDMDMVTNLGEGGLDNMREVYANYFFMAAEGADKAAEQEDIFRIAGANKAKRDFAANQRRMSDTSEEYTAEAMTEINSSIRAAEEEYEQSKSQLLAGGTPSKRKARDVTFKDARPQ